jgi:hypothetical protein
VTQSVETPINSATPTPIASHQVPDAYQGSALITMAGIQADLGKATRGESRRGPHGAQAGQPALSVVSVGSNPRASPRRCRAVASCLAMHFA